MNICVVIPCHNAGPWIQSALQSVADQSYPPRRIIVVDDGSTDDSVEKIRASGVDVQLVQDQCGNAATARNLGVEHAREDWIAFLDSDDFWFNHHLETATGLLEQSHEDVAYLAHHDAWRLDTRQWVKRPPLPVDEPTTRMTHHDLYHFYVGKHCGFPTSGMIFRTDRFRQVGGFDVRQVRRHDADLLQRAAYGHTWSYNPEPSWCYRVERQGSISSNYVQCAYYLLRAMLKNEPMYRGPEMDRLIRRQAKLAVSSALQYGTHRQWLEAWDLGAHRLGSGERGLYGMARLWSSPIRGLLRVKGRLPRT